MLNQAQGNFVFWSSTIGDHRDKAVKGCELLSAFGKVFRHERSVGPPAEDKPLMRVLEPRILLDAAALESAQNMAIDVPGSTDGDDVAAKLA